jgi:hypothetical protein
VNVTILHATLTLLNAQTYTAKAMLTGATTTMITKTTRTIEGREAGGVVAQAAQ